MEIFYQAAPGGSDDIALNFLQSPLGILLITLVAGFVGGIFSHLSQRRS